MDCENIHPELLEFVEEELSGAEAARVEGHLERCEACTSEAKELRHALAALRSSLPLIAPGGRHLTATRYARLKQACAGRVRAPTPISRRRFVAAAAIAAILVSGWFIYQHVASWFTPWTPPDTVARSARQERFRVPVVLVSVAEEGQIDVPESHFLRSTYSAPFGPQWPPEGLDYSRLMRTQPDGITIPVQNDYYDSTEPAYWW